MSSVPSAPAMPLSAHRPQASDVAGRPRPALRERVEVRRWPRRSSPGPARRACPRPRRTARTRRPSPAVSSCRCQRGVDLRAQHGVERAPASATRSVASSQHAGRVHHRGQRVSARSPAAPAHCARSASVAGDDADLGSRARRVERSSAPGASGPRRLTSTQVAHAVLADEMAGEQRAEPAGAAGDQHGPVGSRRGAAPGAPAPGPGAGHEHPAVAHGDLRLARRQHRRPTRRRRRRARTRSGCSDCGAAHRAPRRRASTGSGTSPVGGGDGAARWRSPAGRSARSASQSCSIASVWRVTARTSSPRAHQTSLSAELGLAGGRLDRRPAHAVQRSRAAPCAACRARPSACRRRRSTARAGRPR